MNAPVTRRPVAERMATASRPSAPVFGAIEAVPAWELNDTFLTDHVMVVPPHRTTPVFGGLSDFRAIPAGVRVETVVTCAHDGGVPVPQVKAAGPFPMAVVEVFIGGTRLLLDPLTPLYVAVTPTALDDEETW